LELPAVFCLPLCSARISLASINIATIIMMRSTSDPESTNYEEKSSSSCRYYPFTRQQEVSWHPEAVATHLASLCEIHPGDTHLLQTGWSERQVAPLRQRYGVNLVAGDANSGSEHSGNSPLSRLLHSYLAWVRPVSEALLGQLKEPLILMLLGSAGISVALGNVADAASIAVALLIVSAVAAVQEYRSELALEQLQNMVPHTCTVLRDGVVRDDCLARDLVVGDLVLLQTGDRVPADCRVVDAVELALDESALTGETHSVHKTGQGLVTTTTTTTATSRAPALTEQLNMVFAGTLVFAGRGRAVVVAVGSRTEFGKVASELKDISSRKSPLQVKIDELSQRLAFFSTAAIALIAIIGWLLGRAFLETLTVAVSLAVAAIPEGLPICVTVTLALGVLRMARRNAIVKKLPVVESLGCATAVASDKTGTLTQNESA